MKIFVVIFEDVHVNFSAELRRAFKTREKAEKFVSIFGERNKKFIKIKTVDFVNK